MAKKSFLNACPVARKLVKHTSIFRLTHLYNIPVTVAIFRIEFLGEQVPLGIPRVKKNINNGMEKFQIALHLISFASIYNPILVS